jgi:hypothetical protein
MSTVSAQEILTIHISNLLTLVFPECYCDSDIRRSTKRHGGNAVYLIKADK